MNEFIKNYRIFEIILKGNIGMISPTEALKQIKSIVNAVNPNASNNAGGFNRNWVKVVILHISKPQLTPNAQRYRLTKDSKLKPFNNESSLALRVVDDNGQPLNVKCYSASKYCDVQGERNLVKFIQHNYSAKQTAYLKMITSKLFTDIKREI